MVSSTRLSCAALCRLSSSSVIALRSMTSSTAGLAATVSCTAGLVAPVSCTTDLVAMVSCTAERNREEVDGVKGVGGSSEL